MRSRTGSLPRSRWRAMDRSSPPAPPSARAAWRARSSSTSDCIAALLLCASSEVGSIRVVRTAIADDHRRRSTHQPGCLGAGDPDHWRPSSAAERAPSPFVIRDDVEHGSSAAVRAPRSGMRARRPVSRRSLVTVEATRRPLPRRNMPERDRHRSRWPGPQIEPVEAEIHRATDEAIDRLPSRAGHDRLRRHPFASVHRECPTAFDGQELIYTFATARARSGSRRARSRSTPGPALRAVNGMLGAEPPRALSDSQGGSCSALNVLPAVARNVTSATLHDR